VNNYFEIDNIAITGISCAVPSKTISIEAFKKRFGEEAVDKYVDIVGVKELRVLADKQTASDLGYVAARELLNKKELAEDEIDGIIFVSLSPDYRRPSTACVIHNRLNLKKECIAFDVGLGCSGFVYGIQILASIMQCSNMNKGIVIIAESLSKLANHMDRSCSMLLGDAGSAILLEKVNSKIKTHGLLYTDGSGYRSIIVPGGGFRNLSPSNEEFQCKDGNIRSLSDICMNGVDIFSFAVSEIPKSIKQFEDYTKKHINDYDCVIFHQANKSIINQICKRSKITKPLVPMCIEKYGNVSGPSIPLALCDAYGNNNISEVIKFISCAFGVGLSWGILSSEVNCNVIFPIVETDEYYADGMIDDVDLLF